MTHSLIIGAGLGGLTTAALLRQAGHQVTVLEAHVYPGGCAGTFFHKGFRFDAGATLAGGFAAGGPHARLAEMLELTWPVAPVDPAWVVHLPDGRTITQWADPVGWQQERQAVFPRAESFWQTQERLAAIAWDVSSRPFPWPPQSAADCFTIFRALRPQTMLALPYLFQTVSRFVPPDDPLFQAFLDAQLLISAQTTSQDAHALYGSAALDLPRRGVNHVRGGIGALADTLVNWIRLQGGAVHFRQQVERIIVEKRRATEVITHRGARFTADQVIANVTPWALVNLLGDDAPRSLMQETQKRLPTWGAFTLYLGLDERHLLPDLPAHHQVIVDHTRPLGEGNTVFISLSEPGDTRCAPEGMRTATLSTHTAVTPWLQLRQTDSPAAYCERREEYTNRLLAAAERVVPGLCRAIRLCLPGTPVTFATYTRRPSGMVGGFPQTSFFQARGPGTGIPNLWLVGDSIFPGQSTAGVTLGGMRVATAVLQSC